MDRSTVQRTDHHWFAFGFGVIRSARSDPPAGRRNVSPVVLLARRREVVMGLRRNRRGLTWLEAERLARLLVLLAQAAAELLDAFHVH
jgi:hypothetical protein